MSTIIRIQKTKNYSVISNTPINDASLSFKATGLLCYLLSKPDNWKVYPQQLASAKRDGIKAVYSGLKELKSAGYVEHIVHRSDRGQITGAEYIVYEDPQPNSQNRQTGNNNDGNGPILNTDKQKIKTDNKQAAVAVSSKIKEDLLNLIPLAHKNDVLEQVIDALKCHEEIDVEKAIRYANQNAKSNYGAYLDRTIKNGWASKFKTPAEIDADSQAFAEKRHQAFIESRRQMPTAYLQMKASAGCAVSAQILAERK